MVVDRLLYDDDKHLTRAETTGVIDNLLKEVDNDEDGAICFPEFQQAMQKVCYQLNQIWIYLLRESKLKNLTLN